MATIVDRRRESRARHAASRDRFLKRNKKAVRDAINRKLADSSIENIGKGDVEVSVPKDSVREPRFRHGRGGDHEVVRPGNKHFRAGDRLPKPSGGQGGGKGNDASDGEDGQDDFVFNLSEEEYFQILFEDLGLPNLERREAESMNDTKRERAGFVKEGVPAQVDLVRSKVAQKQRHLAGKSVSKNKIFTALTKQWQILSAYHPDYTDNDFDALIKELEPFLLSDKIDRFENDVLSLKEKFLSAASEKDTQEIDLLDQTIKQHQTNPLKMAKWNENDLRYRHHEIRPQPVTQAVMFCLMDVSYSMDAEKKANAKLYYGLLHRFLKHNYDQVDVRFIRHTTEAEEVDEETFFYDTKSGGTKVSTSVVEMQKIMKKDYPLDKWNIYAAQASDGDNYSDDNYSLLQALEEVLPDLQAYFYTEIENPGSYAGSEKLWDLYDDIVSQNTGKFFRGRIQGRSDILPVFHDFFSRKKDKSQVAAFTPSALRR